MCVQAVQLYQGIHDAAGLPSAYVCHVYMNTNIKTQIYIYIYIYIYMNTNIYTVCMSRIYLCSGICMYVYMCVQAVQFHQGIHDAAGLPSTGTQARESGSFHPRTGAK